MIKTNAISYSSLQYIVNKMYDFYGSWCNFYSKNEEFS